MKNGSQASLGEYIIERLRRYGEAVGLWQERQTEMTGALPGEHSEKNFKGPPSLMVLLLTLTEAFPSLLARS